MNHLRANNVRDVVFLTGDIHTSWASELVTRSTVASPTAVEFIVPSITSDNLNDFLGIPSGITVGLSSWSAQAVGGSGSNADLLASVVTGSLLSIIPLIAAFVLLQRFRQSGLSAGAGKE